MMIPEAIAQQWEIHLRNPDPPGEVYHYPYYLRATVSAWDELVALLRPLHADRFLLVTESAFPTYLPTILAERLRTLAPTAILSFQGGEATKNLETIGELGNRALAAGATRSSVVVGLGGGLVGNVAGLLAGICLRGLPLVHVPTTLLAQSDSCLSLKQGVNGELGKNHFGVFTAPCFVWSHLAFLETLPPREIRAALCELIKNVLAIKPEALDEVMGLLQPDACYSQEQLARIIALCIEIKSAIMANDALEKHEAVALEYGHTVGHACEILAHGRLSHGEAVGIGMVVEADIAHHLGLLSTGELRLHYLLLRENGIPLAIPAEMDTGHLLEIMRHDNKRGYLPPKPGTIDLVLLEALGQPKRTGNTVLTQVPEDEVRAALKRCCAA